MKRPRFWVGPFVAGCCFALGYGITQRVITLQSNAEKPKPEAFSPALFPGESLEGLRGRNGQSSDLQVDLAALEARLEAERKRKEEAEKPADQDGLAEQELQATGTDPVPPAQPAWTEPALPALDLDPPVAAPPAAPNPPVQPAVVAEPEAPPPPAPADQTPLAPPPPIPPPPPAPLPAQP